MPLSLTQQRKHCKENTFTFSCTLGVERPWDPKHFVLGRSLESRALNLQVRSPVNWTILLNFAYTNVQRLYLSGVDVLQQHVGLHGLSVRPIPQILLWSPELC